MKKHWFRECRLNSLQLSCTKVMCPHIFNRRYTWAWLAITLIVRKQSKAKQLPFYASGSHTEEPWKLLFLRQGICGISAIYVQRIQTEILKLASFNRVLLCTWHAFTPKPPICSLHLHCSIFNSNISELPGPLRCLLVCGLLAGAVAYHKKEV